jgi:preprotein translocase subunit SecG
MHKRSEQRVLVHHRGVFAFTDFKVIEYHPRLPSTRVFCSCTSVCCIYPACCVRVCASSVVSAFAYCCRVVYCCACIFVSIVWRKRKREKERERREKEKERKRNEKWNIQKKKAIKNSFIHISLPILLMTTSAHCQMANLSEQRGPGPGIFELAATTSTSFCTRMTFWTSALRFISTTHTPPRQHRAFPAV